MHRHEAKAESNPVALDSGDLGPERKLYCRELIARFGHALALNWNLGEENTQSTKQQTDVIRYLHDTAPYDHLIVVHTLPDWQDQDFAVRWFNPRSGGPLQSTNAGVVARGHVAKLGPPPENSQEDWVVLVQASQ